VCVGGEEKCAGQSRKMCGKSQEDAEQVKANSAVFSMGSNGGRGGAVVKTGGMTREWN
jgi:hypothetical protein